MVNASSLWNVAVRGFFGLNPFFDLFHNCRGFFFSHYFNKFLAVYCKIYYYGRVYFFASFPKNCVVLAAVRWLEFFPVFKNSILFICYWVFVGSPVYVSCSYVL